MDTRHIGRRDAIRTGVTTLGAIGAAGVLGGAGSGAVPEARAFSDASGASTFLPISLAQWSFHRALEKKELDNLDFAKLAKREFGIEGVEYVNFFFKDKAKDSGYLAEMKKRAEGEGVQSLLIMCDGEGALGDPDGTKRTQAVENHYKWADAAKTLGCHSIRVNGGSGGPMEEQRKLITDGLTRLTEYCAKQGLNCIVENHGGLSSNGAFIASVIYAVNVNLGKAGAQTTLRCGTLPDFGNFRISDKSSYDRYEGTAAMIPFAKALSAKSYGFDEKGDETTIDYRRMLTIARDAGYSGWIGIEYEGDKHSEKDGVRLTKELIERIKTEMA